MGTKCLKCGYERAILDGGDEAICPKCGAVYAKVEAHLRRQQEQAARATPPAVPKPSAPAKVVKVAVPLTPAPVVATKGALRNCKDCGGLVSKNAATCPHCGAPMPKPPKLGCGGLLLLLMVLGIFGAMLAPTPPDSPAPRPGTPTSPPRPTAAAPSPPPRVSDAECRRDLQCWGDRHSPTAGYSCRRAVERLAKFSHEWTDGWLGVKFSHFRWLNRDAGQLTYLGDSIRFQNGFGAWQNYSYACDYDPRTQQVLDARAWPGRMPE